MELKIQKMTKLKVCSIFYFALLNLNADCQKCEIHRIGFKSFSFSDTGVIAEKYKLMSKDTVMFNALFVTKNSFSGKVKLDHITIDSMGNVTTESGFSNSFLSSTKRNLPAKDINTIFKTNDLDGFYESTCELGSTEQTQLLVLSNPLRRKWIELVCFDGQISDILKEKKEFSYLYSVYLLLFDK